MGNSGIGGGNGRSPKKAVALNVRDLGYYETLHIRINIKQWNKIHEYAKNNGTTMNALIRRFIDKL